MSKLGLQTLNSVRLESLLLLSIDIISRVDNSAKELNLQVKLHKLDLSFFTFYVIP